MQSRETYIRANQSWWSFPLGELFAYRDLLLLLVKRDFVAKYKQTVLGPLWFVIQPVVQTLVFTIIFGKVAKIPTDNVPPLLFYLCGLMGWNYFSQTFSATANTFQINAGIFGKVYFPRLIPPISVCFSNLIAFGIQLVTFLCFWTYYVYYMQVESVEPHLEYLPYFPVVVLYIMLLALSCGLIMSSLTAKYRDFGFLMGFMVQIWMYATPVIYPLSLVPERWRILASLNPMTSVMEYFKFTFLGKGTLAVDQLLISGGAMLVLLVIGILMFQRTQRTFIDTV